MTGTLKYFRKKTNKQTNQNKWWPSSDSCLTFGKGLFSNLDSPFHNMNSLLCLDDPLICKVFRAFRWVASNLLLWEEDRRWLLFKKCKELVYKLCASHGCENVHLWLLAITEQVSSILCVPPMHSNGEVVSVTYLLETVILEIAFIHNSKKRRK